MNNVIFKRTPLRHKRKSPRQFYTYYKLSILYTLVSRKKRPRTVSLDFNNALHQKQHQEQHRYCLIIHHEINHCTINSYQLFMKSIFHLSEFPNSSTFINNLRERLGLLSRLFKSHICKNLVSWNN